MNTKADLRQTEQGPVSGVVADGMQQYLGVPYAAPPVGNLRWRPPAPAPSRSGVLDAAAFGPVCAQDTTGILNFGYMSDTEDCLYLNVFTPKDCKPGNRLPVMVWIPGGGLNVGGSNGYDPRALVNDGNVVFVSINYRLNVFGFFSHPAINAEGHANGNYGIMDQQAALRWVQKNISNFGGDPGNVTIFGESAGGVSVNAHLASPASANLFHKAILQSSGPASVMKLPRVADAAAIGEALIAATGCQEQTADALRALTTAEITKAVGMAEPALGAQYLVGLMVDGEVLPDDMGELFASGRFHHVPIMIGINRDEFTWFLAALELATGQVLTEEAYPIALGQSFAAFEKTILIGTKVPYTAVPEIMARYPVSAFANTSHALSAVLGDCGAISAGARLTARLFRRYVAAVYLYEWNVPDSHSAWPPVSFAYKSGHTQELQYIFPRFAGGQGTPGDLTPTQAGLATQMVQYWTNFARTGTPNDSAGSLPVWVRYEPTADNALQLEVGSVRMENGFGARHRSDFWDQFYPLSTRT
jgi:para-nitrobenzyl esterase